MSAEPSRPLVVIVGMGETGVLTATKLAGCDVVGIATKRALVSGQELGLRLTTPRAWRRDYLTELSRFKRLGHVKLLFGRVARAELDHNRLVVELADGGAHVQPYDYLVIASGVTNGFWRDDKVTDAAAITRDLKAQTAQLAKARTIAVVGGGATGTSVAANLAARYPTKSIHLFHSGDLPLPGYPDGVRAEIAQLLADRGVRRSPHHRAEPDSAEAMATLGGGTIRWQTGQAPFAADAILWATGATRPNTAFLPPDILDPQGYVLTEPTLQVSGRPNVFAIGDVAHTDPHRSSARNWAYTIVAGNIAALVAGDPDRMTRYEAPPHRWGSILGTQKDGLTVYLPNGGKSRFKRWYVRWILYPFKVRRDIYGGVRPRLWS